MAYVTKRRWLSEGTVQTNARYFTYDGGSYTVEMLSEVQRIVTESHSPYFKKADGSRDVGGPFESWKVSIDHPGRQWHSRHNYIEGLGWQYDTRAYITPSYDVAGYAKSNTYFDTGGTAYHDQWLNSRVDNGPAPHEINAMGTKAIDLVKPTNPTVDLATSLAELWSERKFFSMPGSSGGVSGEYLNYQFGIAPTVSDIQDLRTAIENRDAIIRQYQRDSEKIIRRQYQFEPESTSETKVFNNVSCAPVGAPLAYDQAPPAGTLTRKTTKLQTYKFAGAFRYSIPKESFPAQLHELDRLYGVVPGVSTAWELVPFSWLVDYFTPIGSLLSNLDDFLVNGLVLPYAYIMSTTQTIVTYDWTGPITDSAGKMTVVNLVSTVTSTRMRRVPATPFGFGLLPGDLSPKQLSILAALGMSLRK